MWTGDPALGYMALGQWAFDAPLEGCIGDVRIIERRGAIGKYQLRNIILPLTKPGIVAGCILVFIPGLGAYITPELLGGGKELMIGNLIEQQFLSARNWPFGAALGMMVMAAVLVLLLYYIRIVTREERRSGGSKVAEEVAA